MTGAGGGDDAGAAACEGGTGDWDTAAGRGEPVGVLGDCAEAGKLASRPLRSRHGSVAGEVAGEAASDDAIDRIDRAARGKKDGENGKKGMERVLGMRVDDPLSDRAARQWAARALARVAAAGKDWWRRLGLAPIGQTR